MVEVVTSSHTTILGALAEIVGTNNVLTGDDAAPAFSDCRNKYHADALAVVRPASTNEVAKVVALCRQHDVCIVPQGGNTGLSGGAQPNAGRMAIVLSLMRMNTIEDVDGTGWTMTVQAGVTIEAMQDAAREANRKFAPDWGARGSATIGGGIATNAGGMNVVRYGTMREQVLGLEVVLADGQVWNGLRSLRKDASGYDLKQLFVGSEGTLGVITRATVKLHPATPYELTAMASLASLGALSEVFALANEVAPSAFAAFELMAEVGVAKVCETYDLTHPIENRSDFYLLTKFAGSQPVEDALTLFLESAVEAGLVKDAVVASTREQEERLWMIRDELPPIGLYPHQDVGLKLDMAVPIADMAQYHDAIQDIVSDLFPDAIAYGFGHVGDGNLHMMILPETEEQVEPFVAIRNELEDRIDTATFEFEGTLSAEHGIGRELVGRIAPQKSEIEWNMLRSIKTTLDPTGLLNPGATIPSPRKQPSEATDN